MSTLIYFVLNFVNLWYLLVEIVNFSSILHQKFGFFLLIFHAKVFGDTLYIYFGHIPSLNLVGINVFNFFLHSLFCKTLVFNFQYKGPLLFVIFFKGRLIMWSSDTVLGTVSQRYYNIFPCGSREKNGLLCTWSPKYCFRMWIRFWICFEFPKYLLNYNFV